MHQMSLYDPPKSSGQIIVCLKIALCFRLKEKGTLTNQEKTEFFFPSGLAL